MILVNYLADFYYLIPVTIIITYYPEENYLYALVRDKSFLEQIKTKPAPYNIPISTVISLLRRKLQINDKLLAANAENSLQRTK